MAARVYDSAGTLYRGYQLWTETTTVPVAVGGSWATTRATSLYPYAMATTAVASLANGAVVGRRFRVTDTSNVGWTNVKVGTKYGWVRSDYLTPPYRQFVWNRSNPNVQQYTNYWCVPASVQSELNMTLNRYSTSYSYQQSIYNVGRNNLGYWVGGLGLDPQAWRVTLEYFDSPAALDYVDATYSSYTSALTAGVLQMRKTGRPVGLLVYSGTHAWTMVGYTATADPLKSSGFKVTGVYVAAPFVAWTDPPAGTYYSASAFSKKMTPYWEPVRWTRWNGKWTIVLPLN
jgi:hypothetical protein